MTRFHFRKETVHDRISFSVHSVYLCDDGYRRVPDQKLHIAVICGTVSDMQIILRPAFEHAAHAGSTRCRFCPVVSPLLPSSDQSRRHQASHGHVTVSWIIRTQSYSSVHRTRFGHPHTLLHEVAAYIPFKDTLSLCFRSFSRGISPLEVIDHAKRKT